ncbi:hypothetical protein FHG87_025493 [Trinorchestia longiramus]|nr:hypothetical protein FHG87_025493 [Trinorchestia longiramus]
MLGTPAGGGPVGGGGGWRRLVGTSSTNISSSSSSRSHVPKDDAALELESLELLGSALVGACMEAVGMLGLLLGVEVVEGVEVEEGVVEGRVGGVSTSQQRR